MNERVEVTVPARLHLGFLDLEGGLGRRFGSLGLALEGPYTRLVLCRAPGLTVEGLEAGRAGAHLRRLLGHYGLGDGFRLRVEEAIPPHVGLGSGTQLALAVGVGLARLVGLEADPRALAGLLERGSRSGIGIGCFEQGGVLLDGGRGESDRPPPIIARHPFPEHWRVLLVYDRDRAGAHGADEAKAFDRLPSFPAATAAHLCRLTLLSALPALVEADLDGFGRAVAELQRAVGDYFAPVQGGRFASPAVAEALAWLEALGVAGVGQSSWGPTGFALVGSPGEADDLMRSARRRWGEEGALTFAVHRGRNRGSEVALGRTLRPAVGRLAP